jgi:hypothetical protein
MWRPLAAIVLLLGPLSASGPAPLPAEKAEAASAYLPFVARSWTAAELVVTANDSDIGYPSYYWIYGYVRSPIDQPLYSVAVDIDVTTTSYWPPDEPPSTGTGAIRVSPALSATLPGQVNPFSYVLTLGKASASIGEARAAAGTAIEPEGESYHPLTIVDWSHADATLSGIVRNDSGRTLRKARVVVAELAKCSWREAELATTTLQPGQETTFQRTFFYEFCLGDDLTIVGQGAALR